MRKQLNPRYSKYDCVFWYRVFHIWTRSANYIDTFMACLFIGIPEDGIYQNAEYARTPVNIAKDLLVLFEV